MDNFQISEFSVGDWETYKAVRLESLRDSPDSFGSTFKRESEFTEKEWKSRLMPSTDSVYVLPLVAVSNGKPLGLATGAVHSQEESVAHVYQMWVSKSHRGLGIGKALLKRIEVWAIELHLKSLLLAVTTSNKEAMSLYQSTGFVPSGALYPLRDGSELLVQPMALELSNAYKAQPVRDAE